MALIFEGLSGVAGRAGIAAVFSLFLLAPAAPATSITFAQFKQLEESTSTFVWSNPGGTSDSPGTATLSVIAAPVQFSFSDIFATMAGIAGSYAPGDVGAVLNLTATASTPASSITPAGGVATLIESFDSGSLVITQAGTGTLLLAVNWTGGRISGASGGDSGTVTASDPPDPVVTFTSAVFDPGLLQKTRAFSIGLSGITPSLLLSADGQLRAFSASGAATFSGNFQNSGPFDNEVPEPGTAVLLGAGLIVAGVLRRTRRL